jgi:hypothetical protein
MTSHESTPECYCAEGPVPDLVLDAQGCDDQGHQRVDSSRCAKGSFGEAPGRSAIGATCSFRHLDRTAPCWSLASEADWVLTLVGVDAVPSIPLERRAYTRSSCTGTRFGLFSAASMSVKTASASFDRLVFPLIDSCPQKKPPSQPARFFGFGGGPVSGLRKRQKADRLSENGGRSR